MKIRVANTSRDFDAAQSLFKAYAEFLNVDLCFQGFDKEMDTFPATYQVVLVGEVDNAIKGAVALKALDHQTCEMKRLYVLPEYQRCGLGRQLCIRLILEASRLKYKWMRLDTLERLKPALALYQNLGFHRIDAYYDNPLDEVVYMEKDLSI